MKTSMKTVIYALFCTLFIMSCQENNISDGSIDQEINNPESVEGDVIPGQYIILFDKGVVKPAIDYYSDYTFSSRKEKNSLIKNKIIEVEAEVKNILLDKGIGEDQISVIGIS